MELIQKQRTEGEIRREPFTVRCQHGTVIAELTVTTGCRSIDREPHGRLTSSLHHVDDDDGSWWVGEQISPHSDPPECLLNRLISSLGINDVFVEIYSNSWIPRPPPRRRRRVVDDDATSSNDDHSGCHDGVERTGQWSWISNGRNRSRRPPTPRRCSKPCAPRLLFHPRAPPSQPSPPSSPPSLQQ